MESENRPFLNSRWSVVAGGFLIALMGGLSYSWGVFVEPMCENFGWTKFEATLPLSVFMAVFALVMIPAGQLQDKYGPRLIIVWGAFLFLAANLLSALIDIVANHWLLVVTYGVLGGTACGLTYSCVSPPIRKWFFDKPGLAVSLGVMGFGIASFVFAPLKANYLLPGWGISGTFIVLAILTSSISLLASRLVVNPPLRWHLSNLGAGKFISKSSLIRNEMLPTQMLRNPLYWLVWATFLMMVYGSILIIVILPSYGKTVLNLSGGKAAFAVAIYALINGLGRPLAGILSDRFGILKIMIFVYALQTLVFLSFPYFVVGFDSILIAAVCLGLSIAVSLSLFPVLTAECFGIKHLGINYGLVFSAYGFGAIAIQGGTILHDITGSYNPALLIAGVMSAIGTLLAMIIKSKYKMP
ncbi:MAG: OFA family MFS transporter [Candidatus Cloacimonadaceae bacterium]